MNYYSPSVVNYHWLVVYQNPSEKYDFVKWDMMTFPMLMEKQKSCSSHHQPDHQQSLVISDYHPQTDDPLMIIPKPLTEQSDYPRSSHQQRF